jgi:transcriptional regulator with XRE-family HTH domain
MPSLSKMTHTNGKPMPHLGRLVTQVMQQQHISQAELARRLGVSGTTLMRSLQQHTIHAALLWKMGQLLGYNFFAGLAAEFPLPAAPTANELALQQQIAALEQEVEVYKRVVEVVKSIKN